MIRNTITTIITLLLWSLVSFFTANLSPWSGIGAALLLTFNANACGRLLILSSKSSIRADDFIINLALGLPVIAIITLLTGPIWLNFTSILTYIAIPGCWYGLNSVIRALTECCISGKHKFRWTTVLLFLLSTIAMLFMLSTALCPPSGWDELTYHLTVPVRWLNDKNFATYMDNPFSALPSLFEILFALLIAKGRLMAPRLFNWILLVSTFFGLWRLLKIWLQTFSSWCFCTAFLLSPVTLLLFREVYAEAMIVFLLIAFLHLIHSYSLHKLSPTSMVLAGIVAGAILGTKPTGIIVIFFIMILLLLKMRNTQRSLVTPLIAFSVACTLITLPFYLRTWFQTGLPVFPFGAQYFTNNQSIINTAIYHHAATTEKYGDHHFGAFVLNLFRLSFDSRLFGKNIGWQLMLAMAVLIIQVILQKRCRKYEYLWYPIGAFFCYCIWFFSAQQARFFIPYFIIMLIGAAIPLANTKKLEKFCGIIILVLSLFSLPVLMISHIYNCWFYPLGKVNHKDYLYSITGSGYLPAIGAIKALTPENAKVLLMFDPRGLYIPRCHEVCTPYFQAKYFTANSSLDELRKQFEYGCPIYILLCAPQKIPFRYPDYKKKWLPVLAQLNHSIEAKKAQIIWTHSDYFLIRLLP